LQTACLSACFAHSPAQSRQKSAARRAYAGRCDEPDAESLARVSITDVISNDVLAHPAMDVSPPPRSPRQCETHALPFARQSRATAVSDAVAGPAVGGSALAFCAVAVAPPHASEPRDADTSIELVVRSASRRFMRRSYTAGTASTDGLWTAIGGIVGVIQQIGGCSLAAPNLNVGRGD
jgi:hypothetical protein